MSERTLQPVAVHPQAPRRLTTVNVEMDDKSFLFPQGKAVSHLVFTWDRDGVLVGAAFHYNQARSDGHVARLTVQEAVDLTRYLVEAFYQSRSQTVLSDSLKATVIHHPNGFQLVFEQEGELREVYCGQASPVRLARGLSQLLDANIPTSAN